jgi:SOS-response transcriptional repressor LexA
MTDTQRQILKYIRDYVKRNGGISPSYDNIASGCKKSVSTAHEIVNLLDKDGYVTRKKGRARTIYLTRKGEGVFQ